MNKLTSRIIRLAAFALVMSMFLPLAANSAKAIQMFPTTVKIEPWANPSPWGAMLGFDVAVDKLNIQLPLTGKLCLFVFVKGVLPQPVCAKPSQYGWATFRIPNTLARGQYMVKAVYTGDSFFLQSEANMALTVGPNVPKIKIDDGSCPTTISKSGQPALWVTITPDYNWMARPNIHPTGQVVLYDGNQWAGAANVQASDVQYAHGIAWFGLNPYPNIALLKLSLGVHQLTATYVSNDDNFWSGQSAVCTVTVTA